MNRVILRNLFQPRVLDCKRGRKEEMTGSNRRSFEVAIICTGYLINRKFY